MLVVAGINVSMPVHAATQEMCFADWSTALPIVQREILTPVRDLHIQVRRRNIGDLVRITLCTEGDRYIYRLLLREPTGNVAAIIVDARKPF